jgi:hypothetical protein
VVIASAGGYPPLTARRDARHGSIGEGVVQGSLMQRYAIGGFGAGALAGGAIVFLLNFVGGGDNLMLPFGIAAGGAWLSWMQLGKA